MMGCAVLLGSPRNLVNCIAHGLLDEQWKVKTMTSLAPCSTESFGVLKPLWVGICIYQGKSLALFLKAIGSILPLADLG